MSSHCAELVDRLDRAVTAPGVDALTRQVKADLEDLLSRGALVLPPAMIRPGADSYARRLLHRDPAGRYTVIVMVWGTGQGTKVHDHGGMWCVEGVVDGAIAVTHYDVQPDGDGLFHAEPRGTLHAGVGQAGRLIPPTDYHVIANARSEPSVTLHVYGGELNECLVFEPTGDGRYAATPRRLSFDE